MTEGITWFLPIEEQFIIWLQQLGNGSFLQTVLIALNNVFSFFGEEMICIAVMGFVYWGLDKKKGEVIALAIMFANVSIGLLKNVFSRLRPYIVSDRIDILREVDGYSFPSGHSANSTALYPTTASVFGGKKWLKIIAIALPLLIGVSRCYLGAHWPTDVLVGWCLGLVSFAFAALVLPKMKNKYVLYIILIAVSSVGLFYCRTSDYYNAYGMLIGLTLGLLMEEKTVKFENTTNIFKCILRTAIGCGLYFGLSTLIKLFIGNIFPEDSYGWFIMRTVRYGIVAFLLIGVYPMAFRWKVLK